MPTHNAYLLEQSSAQSLCDCPQLELPSHGGLCHQNTNSQAFPTDLISTNWSIASNAQLSSRPFDFVMMHLMHKCGITTIISCCRDMFMYRTFLNRNNDTETMGETQDQLHARFCQRAPSAIARAPRHGGPAEFATQAMDDAPIRLTPTTQSSARPIATISLIPHRRDFVPTLAYCCTR